MSDNIPFDIQMEIIKKVSDVKSLIRFRSVSKPLKSFIDTSDFINGYGARHTQPHSFMLMYKVHSFMLMCKVRNVVNEVKFIHLLEDDKNETFKVQEQEFAPFVVSPLLKQYHKLKFVGACHGLVCLCDYTKRMFVVWNPSIGKSFGIAASIDYYFVFGFGVCPITRDPTVVKLKQIIGMPWDVEVFTLSSGVWNKSSNLLRESVRIMSSQVVIDRFIYWAAYDVVVTPCKDIVVSFDLITKEFKVIDLPYSLTRDLYLCFFSVSKLRESLVVYGSICVDGAKCCGVWVMEHDSSFRKLFTIGLPVDYILGFRKSGDPIFETSKGLGVSTVDVYDHCSQQIKNLGIYGVNHSFFIGSYKESLLLLNHSDSHIYYYNN